MITPVSRPVEARLSAEEAEVTTSVGAGAQVGPDCTLTDTTVHDGARVRMTTATFGFTPVAYNATHYCRSGANKGLYRIPYNTSATAQTYKIAYPYDIAVGGYLRGS